MDHTLARILLEAQQGKFNDALVRRINREYEGSARRLKIIQYCVLQAFHNREREDFHYLSQAAITHDDRCGLVTFLVNLLEQETDRYFFQRPHPAALFELFIGLELISPTYAKTLNSLLRFELNNLQNIALYTALGIIAVVNLDLPGLEKQMAAFSKTGDLSDDPLTFDPACCFRLIHEQLKHGNIAYPELRRLTQDANLQKASAPPTGTMALNLLLGTYTCALFSTAQRACRLTTRVIRLVSPLSGSTLLFFLEFIKADACLKTGAHLTAMEVFQDISDPYTGSTNGLSPYMQTIWQSFKIKTMLHSEAETEIAREMMYMNRLIERSGSRVTRLYLDMVMTGNERLMAAQPELRREATYHLMKTISLQGLNREIYFVAGRLAS